MSTLAEEMGKAFAFSVGDIVYFKTALHDAGNVPRGFVVLERLAQQCSGGIQLQYTLEGATDRFVAEIALVGKRPEFQRICDAYREELETRSWGSAVRKAAREGGLVE